MNARNEELKAKYHEQQRKGMQDLRFMLLLLAVGLILYTALGFYLVYSTQEKALYLPTYLLYEVGSFVAWCIPIRLLWNFNRLGRLLFLICIAASAYMYRDIFQLIYLEVHPEPYKYFLIGLFIGKCCILLICAYRLMAGKSIRMIWSVDTIFDEDLALLELPLETSSISSTKIDPLVEKARLILKRAAIRLGIVLYLSMLLIMLVLALLQDNIPEFSEGISAIQYALFSECLFSIMLWSAPIIALYIGKSWSPYVIYMAILGEMIRIIISYQSYMDIFSNQIIPLEVKFLFVMIELMRYILLLFACRRIWHSRLIKRYSRMKFSKNDEKEKET